MSASTGSGTRIAITGASGFVGRGLVARLATEVSYNPVRIVRRVDENPTGSDLETHAVGDIGDDPDWRSALAGVDAVVHTAARVHLLREESPDPLTAFRRTNVKGTLALARQAAAAGVQRFIFLSSIHVNGVETTGAPFTEICDCFPESAYAQSKFEAEQGLCELEAATGMAVVMIRPPLVYGPGDNGGVPGNFGRLVRLIQTGMPLPLASVTNRRSFIARDNLVDFITTCLRHPDAAGEIFVISDDDDRSTPDLIRAIAAGLGKPARLWPLPPAVLRKTLTLAGRSGMARQLCGSLQIDITKARTRLGWMPPLNFEDAIHAALENP